VKRLRRATTSHSRDTPRRRRSASSWSASDALPLLIHAIVHEDDVAHHREAPPMRYHFSFTRYSMKRTVNYSSESEVDADLSKPTLQLGISEHCETTWYGSVYHAICLFTSPADVQYSYQPRQCAVVDVCHNALWTDSVCDLKPVLRSSDVTLVSGV